MSNQLDSIFVISLGDVVAKGDLASDFSSLGPNPLVSSFLKHKISDARQVVAVISSTDFSKHTATWFWMLRNFKITSYRKPIYLLYREEKQSEAQSAVQHVSFLTSKYPSCKKITCIDSRISVLEGYRNFLKAQMKIPLWDLYAIINNKLVKFDSSYTDKL